MLASDLDRNGSLPVKLVHDSDGETAFTGQARSILNVHTLT